MGDSRIATKLSSRDIKDLLHLASGESGKRLGFEETFFEASEEADVRAIERGMDFRGYATVVTSDGAEYTVLVLSGGLVFPRVRGVS